MPEFVVVNSPSLQTELLKLRIPVADSGMDTQTATQQIYKLALARDLAGIIIAPPLSLELVGWFSAYADQGVPILMLGDQGGVSRAQVLPLPSSLKALVNTMGYGAFLSDVPDLGIDVHGAIVRLEAPRQSSALPIPVLFSISGKGGVGKTTIGAIQVANFAHAYYGSRVLLIDGNAGQGDVRRYLKLHWNASDLPDITHYTGGGSWRDIVINSQRLQELSSLVHVPFDIIFAPAHGTAQEIQAPPAQDYLTLVQAIEADPERPYDLLVIDTQIVETNYTGLMVRSFVVPLLQSGAFAVGVFDNSTPGYNNTKQAIQILASSSRAGGEHFAFIANKLDGPIQTINDSIDGVWLAGQIPKSSQIEQIISEMGDPANSPELYSTIARLLNRVLGGMPAPPEPAGSGKKKGLPFLRRRKT